MMVYKNKHSVSSLVLGIIGVVFSVILPVVTYACSIPGLVIAVRDKKRAIKAQPGVILNIVALAVALINSLFAVVITIKMSLFDDKKEIK